MTIGTCNHCQSNCACPPTVAGRHLDINERRGCAGGTCTCPPQATPCETCGQPTRMTGTKRCDWCYETESRLSGYLQRGGAKAREFVTVALRDAWRVLLPEREAHALTVSCRYCEAGVGEPCMMIRHPHTALRSAHLIRVETAEGKR